MNSQSPYFLDPLERTRFHEAGHVVVLWRLFADIPYHVYATHAVDDLGNLGTLGMALMPTVELTALDVGLYERTIATFFGGREAVAEAVHRLLIEDLTGADEERAGDRGFVRPPSAQEPTPYYDEDWVKKLSLEVEFRQRSETSLGATEMIGQFRMMDRAQGLARCTLREHWDVVLRLVEALRINPIITKLPLRDVLVA